MNLYALMFYNEIYFRFPNEMSPVAREWKMLWSPLLHD